MRYRLFILTTNKAVETREGGGVGVRGVTAHVAGETAKHHRDYERIQEVAHILDVLLLRFPAIIEITSEKYKRTVFVTVRKLNIIWI